MSLGKTRPVLGLATNTSTKLNVARPTKSLVYILVDFDDSSGLGPDCRLPGKAPLPLVLPVSPFNLNDQRGSAENPPSLLDVRSNVRGMQHEVFVRADFV